MVKAYASRSARLLLWHDLAAPSRGEWFVRIERRSPVTGLDTAEALRRTRKERDEQMASSSLTRRPWRR